MTKYDNIYPTRRRKGTFVKTIVLTFYQSDILRATKDVNLMQYCELWMLYYNIVQITL